MLRTPRRAARPVVAARRWRADITPKLSRRRIARTLTVAVALTTVAGYVFASVQPGVVRQPHLYGAAVALSADGSHVLLPNETDAAALLPGSRVLAPTSPDDPNVAAAEGRAAAQRAWLESGDVPGKGTRWESMTRDALLDLRTLTPPTGGTAAGWVRSWRYVWPRDASFVAVAFARTGHLPDAERELTYLQRVQRPSGLFDARYLLDGSGPPDERWLQSDGTGWALWATHQVVSTSPRAARRVVAEQFRSLIQRSTATLLRLTNDGRVLPPPSPDYRELPEDAVTVGTAGPFLAGLQAAGPLARSLGDTKTAQQAEAAAARFAQTVATAFGPDYPRTVGSDDVDAAVAFLLPPFITTALPGSIAAAAQATRSLLRPGGGLAPGPDWPHNAISWTPETALFALASASTGDRDSAVHWLDWLDVHRTGLGALPEKVDGHGHPAGPAPLAWTDALVLLTVATLDR